MSPLEIITVLRPSLASDANVNNYITLATQSVSATFYGANYELAIALLACHTHYLAVTRDGSPGVVTYQGAGRLMQSTGGLGVIRDDLELSNYGMQLQRLKMQSPRRGCSTSAEVMSMFG
jgi:hypothetical protein